MDGICVVYSIRELIFQSFLRWSSYEKIENCFHSFLSRGSSLFWLCWMKRVWRVVFTWRFQCGLCCYEVKGWAIAIICVVPGNIELFTWVRNAVPWKEWYMWRWSSDDTLTSHSKGSQQCLKRQCLVWNATLRSVCSDGRIIICGSFEYHDVCLHQEQFLSSAF